MSRSMAGGSRGRVMTRRRRTLTDRGIANLRPRAARYAYPDSAVCGLWVRVQPTGVKSFVVITRDRAHKQRWVTLGSCDLFTIKEARELARDIIKRIGLGVPLWSAAMSVNDGSTP
jgi:Arm DNA-binding domain